MVGVIYHRVKVFRSSARSAGRRVVNVVRVAIGSGLDRFLQALQCLSAEEVVEGAFLHDQNNDILDVVL